MDQKYTEKRKSEDEKSIKNIESESNLGLIHYYFGDGKGKTTTLIGGIIRALGHDLKPFLIQFLKLHDEKKDRNRFFIGEIHYLKELIPVRQFGGGDFVYSSDSATMDDKKNAKEGFECAKKTILSGKYDLIALDEIVDAIGLNLVNLEDLIALLKEKPEHVEIICTGFQYVEKLAEISDYVIKFDCLAHPYQKGILARPGIEY